MARFTATVVFPVPPFPLATDIIIAAPSQDFICNLVLKFTLLKEKIMVSLVKLSFSKKGLFIRIMKGEKFIPLEDGTLYSRRKGFTPLHVPPLKEYAKIVGEEPIKELKEVSERLSGIKMLELSSTPLGGGVAEMLHSSVPFLNLVGIEDEWKVIKGSKEFFAVTKTLHHLLQGKKGILTAEAEMVYFSAIKENVASNIIDYEPDVVFVHDPQPLALARELKRGKEKWIWRCHIDLNGFSLRRNPRLWDFITYWAEAFDAAIFTAAYFVISQWPLPKFIIPPFIDPLSEKNREMSEDEIAKELEKEDICTEKPIISQISRFDHWKDPKGVLSIYKKVREKEECQLTLAGGFSPDDPEGERVYKELKEMTKDDKDIHILCECSDSCINAIQRASSVILQNSKKEGFGLTVTEAMWKGKPVVARSVGGIALQIRDGYTGFLINGEEEAAKRILHLLRDPKRRDIVGKRARRYVREHFLLPVRIVDYLLCADFINKTKGIPEESIISFHPWFKISKRVW
uniref:D-inositol-3-phosphate glycosyltransferase n=1 Tax=Candidatus Methanophagaceae archaeon ANME-1 ERB6 TaxID=2759912 RepID=A0A7G9YU65_9EURY|nr:D-inositol-3-phosphate glycosyltransferase [Methanosarcinales archaeon ANME-1 ERB6]